MNSSDSDRARGPAVGDLVAEKYLITGVLGEGGMGVVFRATHQHTGREVALKTIRPRLASSPDFQSRFESEARAIGALRHPNIVDVTDFGYSGTGEDRFPYLVLEFLEGYPLSQTLRQGSGLPWSWATSILEQVCLAVSEAHRVGVVHGDLKPENVWLRPRPTSGFDVKVLDFGLARFGALLQPPSPASAEQTPPSALDLEKPIDERATMVRPGTGARLAAASDGVESSISGTPAYMSPERWRGEPLSPASDIYSLGVLAYQMLSGKLPQNASGPTSEHNADDLSTLRPDLPTHATAAITQAVSKNAGARPRTARVFAENFLRTSTVTTTKGGLAMFETLLADIRFAFRWLGKSPAFTLLAVASFAIGIGFNTALFTFVDALLFRPLPVERPDRLVDVYTASTDGDVYATSGYPDLLDWKAQNTVFTDMMGFSPSFAAMSLSDRSRLVMGEVVTGGYFQVLGVRAALGRTLLPEDDVPGAARVLVLSHRAWIRDFGGSPSAIGQSLRIHGQPYTIVGVAPKSFTGLLAVLSPELWTTVAHIDDVEPGGIIDTVPSPTGTSQLDRRGQRWMFVKGRLKPGATVEQAGANLSLIAQQLATEYPQTNKHARVSVKRTSDVHIHPVADQALLPIAGGLMVVVGLVLLIACANVASMLLARATGRQKEIGIRLALGASRWRIVRQLVTESLVVAALGAAAGIALAWVLLRGAMTMTLPIPIPLTLGLQMDYRVLAFSMIVTMVAGLFAGLAPALKATKLDLVGELKGDVATAPASRRRFTMRDSLVASQMAVTTVLLVVAALLSRSLLNAQKTSVGFRSEGVAVVSAEMDMLGYTSERGRAFWDQAVSRAQAIPGVEAVALTVRSPMSMNHSRNAIFFPGQALPDDNGVPIDATRVSPEYFETLHVPILRGRGFALTDTPESPAVVVINDALARKYWPDQDAIGKRFRTRSAEGPEFEVVGISSNYRVNTVGESATPYVHFAVTQRPSNGYEILARTRGDAAELLASLRRELLAMEPNIVFIQNHTMETQVGATLFPAKAGAWAVSAVGLVAMLLAAIGLYGVIGYSVSRRTKEIGVRMALGAQPSDVSGLIMRQGLRVAGSGMIVGAVLAAGAGFLISGALYGISPVDPIAWLGAMALLLGVAALANLVPAQRASRVKPWLALRTD